MNHLILKPDLAVKGIPYLTSRSLVGITAKPKQGATVFSILFLQQPPPLKSLIYAYHYEIFTAELCRSSTSGIGHILIPPTENYALLPMAGYFLRNSAYAFGHQK